MQAVQQLALECKARTSVYAASKLGSVGGCACMHVRLLEGWNEQSESGRLPPSVVQSAQLHFEAEGGDEVDVKHEEVAGVDVREGEVSQSIDGEGVVRLNTEGQQA